MSDVLQQEALKQALHYDPETGKFTWREPKSSRMKPGDHAGYQKNGGYWAIRVNGVKYFAHRLAWLYVYGRFPRLHIDHINRDPADNRIANLRDVSRSVNMQNRKDSARRHVAGKHTVRRAGASWAAYHYRGRKYVHLGTFATEQEALMAKSGGGK